MKKIFEYLSGKKTPIAAFLNLAAVWLFQKGAIDQDDLFFIASALSIWTGAAIAHKLMKGRK